MTLFNADNNPTVQTPNQEDQLSGEAYLDKYVGDGKKYKTVEDAIKALDHSQNHIVRLEQENALQREEISKRATLEDFLDKIESRARQVDPQQVTPHGIDDGNQDGAQTSLTPQAIKELVKQATLEERTQLTQQENLMLTAQELKKVWGDSWQSKLRAKRDELGLTEDFMNSIAFKSPKALLNLVGAQSPTQVSPQQPNLTPPRNQMQVPTDTVNGMKKNKAYWDKMAKTDPMLYRSPAMVQERHRIAMQMKGDFFE